MQAALLGICFAIILALVAALVGPYFVDWSQYRSVFEREASRWVGMPVRVRGAIVVRVLPTPSLKLRDLELGGSHPLAAEQLAVELALGPLVRGEWRAADMRLVAPQIKIVLDEKGRMTSAGLPAGLSADSLSIDHLVIENGRAVVANAATASELVFEKLWFNGDVRSLAGPVRGEGGFTARGARYGYRLAAGRLGEDGSMKLRLTLDSSDRPVNIEADGMATFNGAVPRFEGTLSAGRAGSVVLASGRPVANDPWRATAKVKASASAVLLDQMEFQFGGEDRPITLAGTAEVKLGDRPRYNAVISARQVDVDRLLGLPEPVRRSPAVALRAMAEGLADLPQPPFPGRLGLSVESVQLAGAPITTIRGDIVSDEDGWDFERFEFRAPGFAQVRLSGRMTPGNEMPRFAGRAEVEATDPRGLASWLQGRSDAWQTPIGPLRASGGVSLGPERIAIEGFKAEIDRKSIEGRLAYFAATGARPARLDAQLKAADLDLDAIIAFATSAGPAATFQLPGELVLAADIERAVLAGVEARNVKGRVALDANDLAMERLRIGDFGGAALEANGRIESLWTAPHGLLTLDLDARRLDGALALLARLAPDAPASVRVALPRLAPAKLRATLEVNRNQASVEPRKANAKLALQGSAGIGRINVNATATGDPSVPLQAELRIEGQAEADDGAVLASLFDLDNLVAVDRRPGSLTVVAAGALAGDLRVDGRLRTGGLDLGANGSVRLLEEPSPSARMDLSVTADAGPIRRTALGRSGGSLPIVARTRLALAKGVVNLDGIEGTLAGQGVRGRLQVVPGSPLRVDGRIEADALDIAGLLTLASGMPVQESGPAQSWSSEPFARGIFGDVTGRIALTASRATLGPSLTARQLRGAIRLEQQEVAFEDVEGTLGGGGMLGQITLRRVADGMGARLRFAVSGADAQTLIPAVGRIPATGRLSLQFEAEGAGRSPATLVGSLIGGGVVALDEAKISGLDAKAFDTVIDAVDKGLAVDAAKLKDMVAAALDAGQLSLSRAEGAFAVTAGQVRLANMIARGRNAELKATGALDLIDGTVDLRLTLAGPAGADAPVGRRPDLSIAFKGPLLEPKRTVDVAGLAGWLTVRAVERQAKKLEILEAARDEAALGSLPAPTVTPPATTPGVPSDALAPRTTPEDRPASPIAVPRSTSARQPPRAANPPPAVERAPALPPPIDIRPPPGASRFNLPRFLGLDGTAN